MSRPAALVCTLSALALAAVAAPGQAAAGTMYGYGSYEGDPGVNTVTASYDGTSVTLTDSAGITVTEDATYPGEGDCTSLSASSVRCAYANGYRLTLDDGNDSFTYVGGAPPGLPPGNQSGMLFTADGGVGADVLNGSPYKDVFRGDGPGVDPWLGSVVDPAGNDRLFGHGGEDDLRDGDGSNHIEGGPGSDDVYPTGGTNELLGGPGNDFMGGGAGADTIDGEDGVDNINGGDGNDMVRGGAGDDEVEGGGDNDVTDGGAGDDSVEASFHGGGCGTDTLIGGAGKDSLYAACGVPTLKMRDGSKDTGRCLPKVASATIQRDAIDEVTGGACERKLKGCGKKGRKGASAAKKKKKKCRKKGKKK